MSKKRLLLDCDEVICFCGYLQLVNEFMGTDYKIDDFSDYYIDDVAIPDNLKDKFFSFVSDKDQYKDAVFLPESVDSINKLSEFYDIFVCSDCRNPFDMARSGRIYASKFNLLYKTFSQDVIPTKNYVFTGTKDIFVADAQVDDLVRNIDLKISTKVLFPAYHNRNVSESELAPKGIIKAGDEWREGWIKTTDILMDNVKGYQKILKI